MKLTIDLTYKKQVVIDIPGDEEEIKFVESRLTPGDDYTYDYEFENFILEECDKQDTREPQLYTYEILHAETDKQMLDRLVKEKQEMEDAINQLPF